MSQREQLAELLDLIQDTLFHKYRIGEPEISIELPFFEVLPLAALLGKAMAIAEQGGLPAPLVENLQTVLSAIIDTLKRGDLRAIKIKTDDGQMLGRETVVGLSLSGYVEMVSDAGFLLALVEGGEKPPLGGAEGEKGAP